MWPFDTMPGMAAESRVALVTGGTRGIGFAIARRLGEEGLAVAISGRSEETVRPAVDRLARLVPSARFEGRAADSRSERDQEALVEFAAETFGGLDVLVNNAGIGEFAPVDELSPEGFRAVVETNLFGPYYATHFAVPLLAKRGGGFIVNIASLAAVNAFAGGSAYNASKFGLLGFSEASMLDLRHRGIRVAAVLPGSVATEFGHSHGDREHSWMLTSEDVAEAVVDLIRFPDRAIASRIDLRPSRPPKR
jgi:3-oxoacyl-[acyl-carrier protein] reductase